MGRRRGLTETSWFEEPARNVLWVHRDHGLHWVAPLTGGGRSLPVPDVDQDGGLHGGGDGYRKDRLSVDQMVSLTFGQGAFHHRPQEIRVDGDDLLGGHASKLLVLPLVVSALDEGGNKVRPESGDNLPDECLFRLLALLGSIPVREVAHDLIVGGVGTRGIDGAGVAPLPQQEAMRYR